MTEPTPEVEPTSEDHVWLLDLLPKAAHKKIPAILDYFGEQVAAAFKPFHLAEIEGGRVAIEHVEVYGLEIGVDANGNASTVQFPYGATAVVDE